MFVDTSSPGRSGHSFSGRGACTTMRILWITVVATTMVFRNALAFCVLPKKTELPATTRVKKNFRCFRRNKNGSTNRVFAVSLGDASSDSTTTAIVDQLLDLVEQNQEAEAPVDENAIPELMSRLSSNATDYVLDEDTTPSSLFEPLVGYYNVSYTLTTRPNDNPVGGKWTRSLWTVKRTMQHVLPPLPLEQESAAEEDSRADSNKDESASKTAVAAAAVAQVVNVIRLQLLWGFVGVWVILRGDAVPLKLDPTTKETTEESGPDNDKKKKKKSPRKLLPNLSDRTVKAYFDRPLIGLSLFWRRNKQPFLKRVLTLGPTSAVVLDTPYADNRIRLGKGGTSGSQFVFSRLPDTDEEAREGWKWLLDKSTKTKVGTRKSLTKTDLVVRLSTLGIVLGLVSRVVQQRWIRILAGAYGVISGISILGLVRSTGGIETEGDTYMKGKEE